MGCPGSRRYCAARNLSPFAGGPCPGLRWPGLRIHPGCQNERCRRRRDRYHRKISTENQLSARLIFDFSGLGLNAIVPAEWRIGGKASGHLTYTGDFNRFEHGEVAGSVNIAGATLDMTNVFPTLRKLAKFGGLNDVRIDSIETDLKYKEQRLELSKLHAASQDQIRVEGAGVATPDRLDADLMIGLSPKILGWIPGAEEKVFVDQRDGLR